MKLTEVSEICKVLSDPHRLAIMQQLMEREQCASELLKYFDISQPTLSHHMRIMAEGGLVTQRREGKRTYYGVDRRLWDEFMLVMDGISGEDYWKSE